MVTGKFCSCKHSVCGVNIRPDDGR